MWRGHCVGISLAGLAAICATPARAAETIRVSVDKLTFTPAHVVAHVGDTVEWVNNDFVAHTATSRNTASSKASRSTEWEVAIPVKQSGRITFTSPGEFEYYCRFHPNMIGNISVAVK